MRITFPHMGNVWVAVRAIAGKMGIDLVVPPPTSERTLSLGTRYSPETICLPFKLTLGNMIEALELGADTIMMMGKYGPCRWGYYHRIQEQVLGEMGYRFDMVNERKLGYKGMVKNISGQASLKDIVDGFRFGLSKLRAVDEVEKLTRKIRAIERNKGDATIIFKDAIKAIDSAADHKATKQAKREHIDKLQNVPCVPGYKPLKIGIIGEFFVVVDPFANMNLEIELGKLGVEVRQTQSIMNWLNINPFVKVFGLHEKDKSHRAAKPFLTRHVGGDGWQSVGETVLHSEDWDGIVHLEPFGCLPEITARNIMLSMRGGIPVLNFSLDEHTGKSGMLTRLEAFIDMINIRKHNKNLQLAAR